MAMYVGRSAPLEFARSLTSCRFTVLIELSFLDQPSTKLFTTGLHLGSHLVSKCLLRRKPLCLLGPSSSGNGKINLTFNFLHLGLFEVFQVLGFNVSEDIAQFSRLLFCWLDHVNLMRTTPRRTDKVEAFEW